MFDGGEQFHQFIASSRTSLPIPLSFPLHGNPSFSAAFDPYATPPLHHQPPPPPAAAKSERSTDPWSNDELLALLKVRSSMEIWFPDFTWEHVSRKLGELGFKRSGEQCKEKFEEESRHFNCNKNYRILSELDEFYNADDDQEHPQISAKANQLDQEKEVEGGENETNPSQQIVAEAAAAKKRRRRDKFEMFKGFCEAVVNKMMSKQEELHNKLIQDIVKMDEEKIAREEMWKNQEMDRIKREVEIRSKEQKSAAERQATIIDFLKQFTCDQDPHLHIKVSNNNDTNTNANANHNNTTSNSISNSSTSYHDDVETPSMVYQAPSSPSSILAAKDSMMSNQITPPPPPVGGGDVGKRWPRDEVLALINLRCKMSSNNGGDVHESKEGSKGPLWERISQGMSELGYKRNAKRCKEKWENINKYFRKTKDSSKKRSVNSRTCPYFHHLSCLYSDGTIVAPNAMPENLQ